MNSTLRYIFLLIVVTMNCVTPYDFEPNEGERYFVVSGNVNQLDGINRIKLSYSTRYGSNSNAQPIEDAFITLVDQDGNEELLLHEGNGFYAHYGILIQVKVGGIYHIKIEYRNKLYQTDPQKVPEPVVPQSLSYEVGYGTSINVLGNEISYEAVDIYINTSINVNGNTSYLRWQTDEVWSFSEIPCNPLKQPVTCYMSGKLEPENIFLYSSEGISCTFLEKKFIAQKRINDRIEFIERHYFNGLQYTLPKEAYDYWEKVQNLANPSGDIFDLPPAPLPGNVYNINDPDEIVLGYFEVSSKAVARTYLLQEDIKPFSISAKQYICSYYSRSGYQAACCNCLVLENSSLERPEYW